jgi:hypothetical protein
MNLFMAECHNLHHLSVRAKKYDGSRGIWQGRVNRDYWFYFVTQGDTYSALSHM